MNVMNYVGLYQHFKGEYYYLLNLLRDSTTDCKEFVCQYFNVLHPEYGYFSRPFSEWFTDVSEREDNVTGQITRFNRIKSLDTSVVNLTTEHLMRELANRADSPLQSLDIKGVSDHVYAVDYIIGEPQDANDDHPKNGVYTVAGFDSKYEAFEALRKNGTPRQSIFKRTFLRVNEVF